VLGTEIQGVNVKIIRDANAEISALRNKIAGMEVAEDELRRKNHELMQGWREKARKLAQTQVFLAHIYSSTIPITRGLELILYRNSMVNSNARH